MIFKLVLKGFKLKKFGYWAKKWLNRFIRSTGCTRPVEGGQKVSLSPSGLLFLVKVEPQPVEVHSRSDWATDWGPVEAQRSPAKHLMLTVSQPVDP